MITITTSATAANIDAFVQGESVYDEDLVMWYGGHFVHDADHDGDGGNERHILGPTLKPDQLVSY